MSGHESSNGSALPPGDHDPFDTCEVFWRPHLGDISQAKPKKGVDVFLKVTLYCDHTDSTVHEAILQAHEVSVRAR